MEVKGTVRRSREQGGGDNCRRGSARGNGSPGTTEQGTKTKIGDQPGEKVTRNSTLAAFFAAESASPTQTNQGSLFLTSWHFAIG